MHYNGLNPYNLPLIPAPQSAMAYLAPLTKAMASLIIEEISLLSTSVLIFSPRETKDLISERHDAIS
jgi:hypothetical protein